MECVIAFLMIFVGVLALGGVGVLNRLRLGRGDRALKRLAERYGGTYISGGWFSSPTVQFHYGQSRVPVVVFTAKHSKRGYSHVVIDWPEAKFRCEVLSRWAYLPNQGEFRDLQQLSIDPQFDRRYVVLTNDFGETHELMNEAFRWQLNRLRSLFGDDFVHVSFRRGEMEIVKQSPISSFEHADELVRASVGLFDQGMLTHSVGIEFVAEEDIQVFQEATCQVCGEDVITDMVFCRRCKTPHHMECWQYVGCCAIYGCQETRFLTPHIAEPLAPDSGVDPSVLEEKEPSG